MGEDDVKVKGGRANVKWLAEIHLQDWYLGNYQAR
jgi:hypothetical protein